MNIKRTHFAKIGDNLRNVEHFYVDYIIRAVVLYEDKMINYISLVLDLADLVDITPIQDIIKQFANPRQEYCSISGSV